MRKVKLPENWNIFGLAKIFFVLFVFVMPFQIKTLIYSGELYNVGFFNPYASFSLYLNDIFLIFGLLFLAFSVMLYPEKFGKFTVGNSRIFILLVFLCLSSFVSALYAQNPLVSVFYGARAFEFLVVYLIIVNKVLSINSIVRIFLFSMVVNAFIGIFQYVSQSSLGLSFLGEPGLSPDLKGLAKVKIGDLSVLRAYGTFSHPNVFAGYLLTAVFLSLWQFFSVKKAEYKVLILSCLTVFLLALALTFSRAVMFSGFAAIVIFYLVSDKKIKWKYIIPVLSCILLFFVAFDYFGVFKSRLNISDDAAFVEREQFFNISERMFLDNPFGVGAGNFTYHVQDYSLEKIMPWLNQPVHNTYFLMFNEQGIYGGFLYLALIFVVFFVLSKSSHILMSLFSAFVLVGFFDHYFVSLYQGQLLFCLIVALSGVVVSYKRAL